MPPTMKRLGRRAIKVTRGKVTRVTLMRRGEGRTLDAAKRYLRGYRTQRKYSYSYFDFGLGAEVAESWAERSSDATSEGVGSVRFRD